MFDFLDQIDQDITRNFQFDYLVFDTLFLAIWIALLLKNKRFAPLTVGLICGIACYVIDGLVWSATGVREYRIPAPWIKHPVDFMMDFSYGIIAFSWVWIAFQRRSSRDVVFWTVVIFGGWLLVPLASIWIPLDDDPITTIRHMQRHVWGQIAVVVGGYLLLLAFRYNWKTILYVFWVGSMLAFMMEFSLLVTGIRPVDLKVLVYETLILTNQGIPCLFLIWDKVLQGSNQRNPRPASIRQGSSSPLGDRRLGLQEE